MSIGNALFTENGRTMLSLVKELDEKSGRLGPFIIMSILDVLSGNWFWTGSQRYEYLVCFA
jgi:hypothetical protein